MTVHLVHARVRAAHGIDRFESVQADEARRFEDVLPSSSVDRGLPDVSPQMFHGLFLAPPALGESGALIRTS
jgi:hypothetical protein